MHVNPNINAETDFSNVTLYVTQYKRSKMLKKRPAQVVDDHQHHRLPDLQHHPTQVATNYLTIQLH